MPHSVIHYVSGEVAARQLGLTTVQLVGCLMEGKWGFSLCDGEVKVRLEAFWELLAARNKGAEDAA